MAGDRGWATDFKVEQSDYVKFPDDDAREPNCVHAALVELQSGTAADYWMKGEATVPLSVLTAGSASKKSGGWF